MVIPGFRRSSKSHPSCQQTEFSCQSPRLSEWHPHPPGCWEYKSRSCHVASPCLTSASRPSARRRDPDLRTDPERGPFPRSAPPTRGDSPAPVRPPDRPRPLRHPGLSVPPPRSPTTSSRVSVCRLLSLPAGMPGPRGQPVFVCRRPPLRFSEDSSAPGGCSARVGRRRGGKTAGRRCPRFGS